MAVGSVSGGSVGKKILFLRAKEKAPAWIREGDLSYVETRSIILTDGETQFSIVHGNSLIVSIELFFFSLRICRSHNLATL